MLNIASLHVMRTDYLPAKTTTYYLLLDVMSCLFVSYRLVAVVT